MDMSAEDSEDAEDSEEISNRNIHVTPAPPPAVLGGESSITKKKSKHLMFGMSLMNFQLGKMERRKLHVKFRTKHSPFFMVNYDREFYAV